MSDHVDGAISALREANPIPNPEAFRRSMADPEVFLNDLQIGSKSRIRASGESVGSALGMPATGRDQVLPVSPDRRGWLPLGAVAAGLLLVAAVSALMLIRPADDAPAGGNQPSVTGAPGWPGYPMAFSEFLDGFATFDVDRAIRYLADDADISGIVEMAGDPTVTGTLEEFRLFISWLEAVGYQQGHAEYCTAAAGRQLQCTFDFNLLRSDEVGRGPFRGSYFAFTVRDRQIVLASMHLATDQFSPQVWEPFAEWVSAEHPEDAALMYVDSDFSGVRLTEESIRLWEQHSRSYVEKEAPRVAADTAAAAGIANSFMEARNAYDSEQATALLADEVLVWLMHDNRLHPNMGPVELTGNELALAFEAERILEVRYDAFDCRHDVQPMSSWQLDHTNVTCTYTMDSRLRRIVGVGPLESAFGFRIRDGHIDLLSFPWMNTSTPSFEPGEIGDFVKWLAAEHPEALPDPLLGGSDGHVIRFLGGQELGFVLTPESLDLLAGYLDEYEQSISG